MEIAASVLLEMFFNDNEKCQTIFARRRTSNLCFPKKVAKLAATIQAYVKALYMYMCIFI